LALEIDQSFIQYHSGVYKAYSGLSLWTLAHWLQGKAIKTDSSYIGGFIE